MRKMFIFASKPKEAAFWQKQASLLLRSVCTIFLTCKAKARPPGTSDKAASVSGFTRFYPINKEFICN